MFIIHQRKQNGSFSDTDIEKKKNTEKSVLCAICPDQVKKKIINYNLTTRNYSRKTPAQYHTSVSAKKKKKLHRPTNLTHV